MNSRAARELHHAAYSAGVVPEAAASTAAGIPGDGDSGRVADFHAVRDSYVSALARTGAPVSVVQKPARDSTPTLTVGVQAHFSLHDTAAALDGLTATDARHRGPEAAEPGINDAPPPAESGRAWVARRRRTEAEPCDEITSALPGIPFDENQVMGGQSLDLWDSNASSRALAGTETTEGVGFEPTVGVTPQRFSRPPQSTTLAPLRRVWVIAIAGRLLPGRPPRRKSARRG